MVDFTWQKADRFIPVLSGNVSNYSATNFEQVFAGMKVALLNLKQQFCDYFP